MAKRKKEEQIVSPYYLEKPIGDLSREAYLGYGAYVNNHRHFCRVLDGCKPSTRRLIWASLQYPKGKDIGTATLVPSVQTWHPHDTSGIVLLNASLVRSGVFSGSGSFGGMGIDGVDGPPASPRYTKNRLSDLYWGIVGDLIKEVPYQESPVGPVEPEYIPLPLPLCLIMRDQVSGLGVGAKTNYPTFSAQSLYNAYINNNPQLLEPNIDILMDKENSELERLWKTGKGRVIYAYKISRQQSLDGKSEGVLFEGDTDIFVPALKRFRKLEEEGKVYIEDHTDTISPKLFIARVPGSRGVTIEDIESLCRKICYSGITYNLNVTDGSTSFRIPLFDWLDYIYKNYINLLIQVNTKRIEKVNFDISVQEALPIIADYIMNKNPKATDKEIVSALGIPAEVVSNVMSKPISYLRKNKDTAERIKALKSKLREYKSFNPVVYTEGVISKM